MSYTNGYQTLVQSMNGLLTFNDGAGTIIQNGTITVNQIDTNNINASQPSSGCSLFSNIIGGISVILGNTLSYIQVPGIFSANTIQTYTTGVVNLYTDITSSLFNIGTNSTGTIQIGNTTNTNQIGAVTFQANNITTSGVSGTANILNNITTGALNMGTGLLATKILTLGNTANTNKIGGINIVNQAIDSASSGTASLFGSSSLSNINIGTGSSTTQMQIGSSSTANTTVKIGSTTNVNYIGDFQIQGDTLKTTLGSTVTNLFANQTSDINFGALGYNLNMNSNIILNQFAFTQGLLSIANAPNGYFIQVGRDPTTSSFASATATKRTVTFPLAFNPAYVPWVFITGITTTTNTVTNAIIYSICDTTGLTYTKFDYYAKNTSQSATGSNIWGVTWIAIGAY